MDHDKRGTNPRERGLRMAKAAIGHLALAAIAALTLGACQPGGGLFKGKEKPDTAEAATDAPVASARSVTLVDRDVEAPEVFSDTADALWDGRPSLGGVWVASPDVKDPERVILRNPANGKFVIGALFRRELENPGPKLQISSDAAAALGMLAGAPASISVTALRRDEAAVEEPDATKPILDAAETVETTPLDTAAIASAALDEVEGKPIAEGTLAPAPATDAALADAPAAAAPPVASGGGSLIQVGIFSVEANAQRAVDTLGKAGISASIRKEENQGKAFWSVTARGDRALMKQIKAAGFTDAYDLKS